MASQQSERAPHCRVPLVVVGVRRDVALITDTALKNLSRPNYSIVACLDIIESPVEYRFSANNLGAVLYALHPRPKALITGTAIREEQLAQIECIWEDYVQNTIVNEDLGDHCWVKLSKWHANDAPPPEGWDNEIVRQLDDVFL